MLINITLPNRQVIDCRVAFGRYDNGNTAIQLLDAEGVWPVATATVNLGFRTMGTGVWLKTWSENEGIDRSLIAAGIIGECVDTEQCGFVKAQLHMLTPLGKAEQQRQFEEASE